MTNTSYSIRMIPRIGTFYVCYSHGSNWKQYQHNGKYIEHATWDTAFNWLVAHNSGNVAYVLMHLVDTYVKEELVCDRVAKLSSGEVYTGAPLFTAILDAHIAHKEELDSQQMFYFLRGILYQWCVDHNENVMDMEALFLGDIRYIASGIPGNGDGSGIPLDRYVKGIHTSNCGCSACTVQRTNGKFTAPTLL